MEAIGSWLGYGFHDACALGNRAASPTFVQFRSKAVAQSSVVLRTVTVPSHRLAAFLLDSTQFCPHVVYTTGPGAKSWSGQSRTNRTASTGPVFKPEDIGDLLRQSLSGKTRRVSSAILCETFCSAKVISDWRVSPLALARPPRGTRCGPGVA